MIKATYQPLPTPTDGLNVTVNTCEQCNSGWSSRLEERVYEAAVA